MSKWAEITLTILIATMFLLNLIFGTVALTSNYVDYKWGRIINSNSDRLDTVINFLNQQFPPRRPVALPQPTPAVEEAEKSKKKGR